MKLQVIKSTWQRSWTIKVIKHEYGPVILSIFAVILVFLSLLVFTRSERWWMNEKMVLAPEITWIRTAKAEMTTEQYIRFVFGKNGDLAIAVMMAESHGNVYAINKNKDGSYDLGCWQLNDHWQRFTREQAFDCRWSTDKAFEIYKKWGNTFNAWSAYKNGSYKKQQAR